MAFELTYAERFLFNRLTTSPTADALKAVLADRWYRDRAPQGVVYPYGLYSLVEGSDTASLNQTRIMATLLFWVRIVIRLPAGSSVLSAATQTGLDQTDTLLQTARRVSYGSMPGWTFTSYRDPGRALRKLVEQDPASAAGEITQIGANYVVQVFAA